MSVTNVAEHVHAALVGMSPQQKTLVFEHYPAEDAGEAEHFDEITVRRGQPQWRRWSVEEMIALAGRQVLDDMPALPPDPLPRSPSRPPGLRPPDGPGLSGDLVIHGDARGGLVTVVDRSGRTIGLLPHWVKHSPSGFAWGYTGSGPAELSRCLLIATLGENARCLVCAGGRRVTWDDRTGEPSPAAQDQESTSCLDCDHGIALPTGSYQQFKVEVVAELPRDQDWQLRVAAIRS